MKHFYFQNAKLEKSIKQSIWSIQNKKKLILHKENRDSKN